MKAVSPGMVSREPPAEPFDAVLRTVFSEKRAIDINKGTVRETFQM